MMNKAPSGPRLTKRARERKREAEKADRALGGGQMKQVEGEDATKKVPHWYGELQWFRLLRGQARLNQIARILVELAPLKVFDPRDIYSQHLKEQKELEQIQKAAKGKEKGKAGAGGGGKGKKGTSKKEQIIAANNAKKAKEKADRDAEKLRSFGAKAQAGIKLETESGKLLLLLQLLKTAVRDNNVIDILDTLWEIEAVAEELGSDDGAKAALKSHNDVIKIAQETREDRSALGKKNLLDFQLTEMSDRLPPLNSNALTGKFRLDPWQLRVIELINNQKSVLITAPTSCGKTVLSTYVCTSGLRSLFVVPTEPLAWQVAAMLRALKLDISIVVPTLSYVPPKFDVVVGTPHALESSLTKQVGFDFDWAIFDEVHSLNNDDGPALQRLIRAMPPNCKFLALSATIGNAPDLKRWWETIVGKDNIELEVHKTRFINLQRQVWTKAGVLHLLHPVVSLSQEYLASEGFQTSDLAFTPIDTFNLYKSIDTLGGDEVAKEIKPKKFFDNDPKKRITLLKAKDYEDKLKDKLVDLAKTNAKLTDEVIASLMPGCNAKDIKKGKMDVETAQKKLDNLLHESCESTSNASLTDLMFELKKKDLIPAIVFQLDSVRCQSMFDGLLRELEERELKTHPNYRDELLRKFNAQERVREKLERRDGKKKDDEDLAADQEFAASSGSSAVDVDAPHKDFQLTPPGRGMGATETKDTQDKLAGDLPSSGDEPHPLIRGLRRGIGMYIAGLPAAYHRLVQSFAQQGRLGVVFSDELLAYGVNMPFRTAVFFGDPGKDWLTPLLHQQMAGRAGRRGLDRQGHLVYVGFAPDRLRELLRGTLPDVVGRDPLYPTIPLQLEMNQRWESSGMKLDRTKMQQICQTPLAEFLKNQSVDNYYDLAEKWVEHLGILDHPQSSYSYLVPELVWELRQFLAESLAIQYLLEPIVKKFKPVQVQKSDGDVKHQIEMFLLFCRICSRQPYTPIGNDNNADGENGADGLIRPMEHLDLIEDDENSETNFKHFNGPLPFPNKEGADWEYWTKLLHESQQRILDSDLPHGEQMLLPVPLDVPLDNMCYASFIRNQIDPSLPTPTQHRLRQRIWNIGEVLRITSNVLGRSAELQPIQNLIRKAFIRIRYILDETAQRNWKKLNAPVLLLPHDDDDDDDDDDNGDNVDDPSIINPPPPPSAST